MTSRTLAERIQTLEVSNAVLLKALIAVCGRIALTDEAFCAEHVEARRIIAQG